MPLRRETNLATGDEVEAIPGNSRGCATRIDPRASRPRERSKQPRLCQSRQGRARPDKRAQFIDGRERFAGRRWFARPRAQASVTRALVGPRSRPARGSAKAANWSRGGEMLAAFSAKSSLTIALGTHPTRASRPNVRPRMSGVRPRAAACGRSPRHLSHRPPNVAMDDHLQIGLIGLGEMGRMYAERLHRGGWKRYVDRAAT